MSPGVGGGAGASVVVAVGGHGKRQHFKVGTYLFGKVNAEVSRVPVSLAFRVGKLAGAKIGPDFGVLQKGNNTLRQPRGLLGLGAWNEGAVGLAQPAFFWICTTGHIPPDTSSR